MWFDSTDSETAHFIYFSAPSPLVVLGVGARTSYMVGKVLCHWASYIPSPALFLLDPSGLEVDTERSSPCIYGVRLFRFTVVKYYGFDIVLSISPKGSFKNRCIRTQGIWIQDIFLLKAEFIKFYFHGFNGSKLSKYISLKSETSL